MTSISNLSSHPAIFNLQPILNIELLHIHTQLEMGMLGVVRKLVKGILYLIKVEFEGKEKFLFLQIVQIANYHFQILRKFRN
jgi:hypothetical protein